MQDEDVCSIASAMIKTRSSYKNGPKIVHLNAQSLLKKIDEFRFLFTQSNVDVICVSETWFVHDLCDSSIVCEGFSVYRSDRTGHAGGVAIYVNVKLKCKGVLKQPSDSTM